MKTTTVLILTALFVCTLIGVVVYDQKPVAGNEQRIYEDLNDVAEINQEGEANQILNSETILTNAQTSNSVSEKTQRRNLETRPASQEQGGEEHARRGGRAHKLRRCNRN